jgi:2-dehydropantoate 2-reductase
MRYVVYGAGAVGGVVGGLLHRAGHDVVLIARGEHLAAIQRDGLRLASPSGETRESIPAVGDPADVDWRDGDVVLVTVKSDATTTAAQALAGSAPTGAAVVSLQNGVANERTLLRWFARVYGVCVMAPTAHLEPGLVEAHCHPTPAILDVGRHPSGIDATAELLAAGFEAAGIVSVPRHDIMRWKYRKLVMNLGNAVQAVCRPDDDRAELIDLIHREGTAALAAAGIDPISEAEDRERRGDILQVGEVPGRARSGGSTWQSLQRRTGTIETDYLNGEIVLLGREHDVATPANELIRQEAGRHARNGISPGTVATRTLLDRLTRDVA